MATIKIPGVKAYTSKGKVYAYHRATGTKLKATYGSAEFFSEIEALNKKQSQLTSSEKPGTWGRLVAGYKASPKWIKELKPSTREDYEWVLEWLKPIHDMPVTDIDRGFVIQLRDKAHAKKSWRFANYVLAVMAAVYTWNWDRQLVDTHPIKGIKKIKRPKDLPRANRPWSRQEWDIVISKAPPHLLAPFLLCGLLGWREGEAIKRPRNDYDRKVKRIKRVSSKNGKVVKSAVPAQVAEAIDALFPHDAITLLVNSRGRSWTEDGFRASAFKFLLKLKTKGLVASGLTVHGLRHTCATRLRELGVSKDLRKEMLGQDSDSMAELYSHEADMEQQLDKVIEKMDQARPQ